MNTSNNSAIKPRKILWFFVSIAILGLGIASYILLKALKPVPEQRDQAVLVPQVQTSPLEYRSSPLIIQGNGIIAPRADISLSPQVSGEVIGLHSNMVSGGTFNKGELMVQIDPRTFEANLAEAEANQTANRSNLEFINKQLVRLQSLFDEGFIGEEALDDAISRRDQTLAAIARQEAIIQTRKLDLERTNIRAPFDGIVYEENVDLGDIVSPGRELARFYASDELEVIVALNADDSVFIPDLWQEDNAHNQNAWVSVNHGGRTYQWSGYVHRVESDIDRVTRTVDVVVRIPSPFSPGELAGKQSATVPLQAPPLLVGMYATIGIEGMVLPGHFVIPVSALRQNNTVWIARSEGTLEVTPVEFVRQEGDMTVLMAPDLAEGSSIIISDIALMTDGMRIQAKPADVTNADVQGAIQ